MAKQHSRSEANLAAAEVPPFNKPRQAHVPADKQSLRGMPGYIKTGQGTGGEKTARGHSSIGPKREGPIGHKGRSNNEGKIYGTGHTGQMAKSYKAESTGKAGHYHMSAEGQPASEPHKGTAPIGGHPGRMERMVGRARTHAEGRKKSHMY